MPSCSGAAIYVAYLEQSIERDVIRDAEPAEKAAIYDQLDLKVTFKPGEAKLRAEVTIGPENCIEHAEQCGDTGRVRGPSRTISPRPFARVTEFPLGAGG